MMTENLPTLRPMDAVAALYREDDAEVTTALLDSLSRAIFDQPEPAPARPLQQLLAKLTYRVVKRTTKQSEGIYRNRLLERSGHPYARALLASSRTETQALVEGGDPMNGPYMMIVPEVRKNGTLWDQLFFNSVQGRDVQLRFRWETRATYEEAKKRASKGETVRMKALAAGTGLSMILACDQLLREGIGFSCEITDRDAANTEKTARLLAKLAAIRGVRADIMAKTEDAFGGAPGNWDVVTAVGLLEYLQGFTSETTEQRLGLPEQVDPVTAVDLARNIGGITAPGAAVIVNSYRPDPNTRLLELFGKRFDYRTASDLDAVLAAGGFRPVRNVGSAVIYDVKVYEKNLT